MCVRGVRAGAKCVLKYRPAHTKYLFARNVTSAGHIILIPLVLFIRWHCDGWEKPFVRVLRNCCVFAHHMRFYLGLFSSSHPFMFLGKYFHSAARTVLLYHYYRLCVSVPSSDSPFPQLHFLSPSTSYLCPLRSDNGGALIMCQHVTAIFQYRMIRFRALISSSGSLRTANRNTFSL